MEFIAHKRLNSDGTWEFQTVKEHCEKTAQYASKCLEKVGFGNAAFLVGIMHDMGKYTEAFYNYIMKNEKKEQVIHSFQGCRFILEMFHDSDDLDEKLTAEILAYAVGAHHGLFDCLEDNSKSNFEYRVTKKDIGYEEAKEHFLDKVLSWENVVSIFHKANEELSCAYNQIEKMVSDRPEESVTSESMFYAGLLSRLILSAVIEGDRRDTAEFMQNIRYPEQLNTNALIWNDCLKKVEKKLMAFPTETPIQIARRNISDQCSAFAERPEKIVRLSVPTGAGKTLSSLRFALTYAAKWGKKRLFFVSPLLSVLDQNAKVIHDFIGDDNIILEHHSNVVQIKEHQESLDERELLSDNFHVPVVITTLVQLLNILFSDKTTFVRRFQALCNSVIVIDEVQTVPSRMLSLFNLAVNFLSEICGTTVVLCSATQPCFEENIHPLLYKPKEMVPYDKELWKAFKRTNIEYVGKKRLEDIPEFAELVLESVNSLLIVCNKKEQAEYLFRRITESGENCFHLSASMCMEHRKNILGSLKASLENDSTEAKKTICVATQVIEAGVDISFECVIRLSAGIDNVVQAAGRCNRNGEKTDIQPVYIIECIDEKLTYLREIQNAKNATRELIYNYQNNPEFFNSDLTSDEAISVYYKSFFREIPEGYQDYVYDRDGHTIYSLISDGFAVTKNNKEVEKYELRQAFATAGNLFQVFDEDTTDILVPYGEGKVIIAELCSSKSLYGNQIRKDLLDKTKPFTISVFRFNMERLQKEHAVEAICDGSILVLKEGFYDEALGMVMSPRNDLWEV